MAHPYRTLRAPHALSPRRYPPRAPQSQGTHAPSPLTRRSTVHTLPVFSADVALSIALDAQSVAGQIGVTCRGASLKVRGCRLLRALRTRYRGAGVPLRRRAPLFGTPVPLPASPLVVKSRQRDRQAGSSSTDKLGVPISDVRHMPSTPEPLHAPSLHRHRLRPLPAPPAPLACTDVAW